jgi:hypothetical protein
MSAAAWAERALISAAAATSRIASSAVVTWRTGSSAPAATFPIAVAISTTARLVSSEVADSCWDAEETVPAEWESSPTS